MAYTNPLNPATPADSDPVSSGDDRIRELKAAIIERLQTIIPGFPDTDPLVLNPSVFPAPPQAVQTGNLSARPNPPTESATFYALDTDQVFFSKATEADPDVLEWTEAKPTVVSEQIVLAYSAGESRFAPLGTESNAARVASAIASAALVGSPIKVVYVPKTLWGYVANADFNASMYNTGVLLVREGSIAGWYDPIAYGADLSGTADSSAAVQACYTAAAIAGTLGTKLVAFTLAGTYKLNTNVVQNGVPLFLGEGVIFSGTAALTGTRPWRIPADPVVFNEAAYTYNPAASAGSKAAVVTIDKRLKLKVLPTPTNGSGQLTIDFADASWGGAYDASKIHTIVASERGAAADGPEVARISIAGQVVTLDLDGGVQTATWDLDITFHT